MGGPSDQLRLREGTGIEGDRESSSIFHLDVAQPRSGQGQLGDEEGGSRSSAWAEGNCTQRMGPGKEYEKHLGL